MAPSHRDSNKKQGQNEANEILHEMFVSVQNPVSRFRSGGHPLGNSVNFQQSKEGLTIGNCNNKRQSTLSTPDFDLYHRPS